MLIHSLNIKSKKEEIDMDNQNEIIEQAAEAVTEVAEEGLSGLAIAGITAAAVAGIGLVAWGIKSLCSDDKEDDDKED